MRTSATAVKVFEVRGAGQFPIDMLRYDCCWPSRESEDSHAIIRSFMRGLTGRYTVRLESGSKTAPTAGRWASFGFEVVE